MSEKEKFDHEGGNAFEQALAKIHQEQRDRDALRPRNEALEKHGPDIEAEILEHLKERDR
jgi:hypothetical protein